MIASLDLKKRNYSKKSTSKSRFLVGFAEASNFEAAFFLVKGKMVLADKKPSK